MNNFISNFDYISYILQIDMVSTEWYTSIHSIKLWVHGKIALCNIQETPLWNPISHEKKTKTKQNKTKQNKKKKKTLIDFTKFTPSPSEIQTTTWGLIKLVSVRTYVQQT